MSTWPWFACSHAGLFNSNRIEVCSNFDSINRAKIRTQEFTTKLSKNKRAGVHPLSWGAILGQQFPLSTAIEQFIQNNYLPEDSIRFANEFPNRFVFQVVPLGRFNQQSRRTKRVPKVKIGTIRRIPSKNQFSSFRIHCESTRLSWRGTEYGTYTVLEKKPHFPSNIWLEFENLSRTFCRNGFAVGQPLESHLLFGRKIRALSSSVTPCQKLTTLFWFDL